LSGIVHVAKSLLINLIFPGIGFVYYNGADSWHCSRRLKTDTPVSYVSGCRTNNGKWEFLVGNDFIGLRHTTPGGALGIGGRL